MQEEMTMGTKLGRREARTAVDVIDENVRAANSSSSPAEAMVYLTIAEAVAGRAQLERGGAVPATVQDKIAAHMDNAEYLLTDSRFSVALVEATRAKVEIVRALLVRRTPVDTSWL
jgi:hypothetical protein